MGCRQIAYPGVAILETTAQKPEQITGQAIGRKRLDWRTNGEAHGKISSKGSLAFQ